MSQRLRTVCVGVPVWRGRDFVAETLESLLRQRGVALQIIVSVDGEDMASAAACRPFLGDARVTLVVQARQLGWVGNSSAVLTAAAERDADFACLQPHDDVLDDDYLAMLVAAADANAEAAVVYSDIRSFGAYDRIISQPAVTGSPFERQADVLRHHYVAVSYRGLMRVPTLRSLLPMTGNPCGDFAADTVWLARQALVGDLVRVPHALYHKRYHAGNTHWQWREWSHERRIAAWTRHCLDMLAVALRAGVTVRQRRTLHELARERLLHPRSWTPYRADLVAMPPQGKAAMGSGFDALAGQRTDIGPAPETRLGRGLRIVRRFGRAVFGKAVG